MNNLVGTVKANPHFLSVPKYSEKRHPRYSPLINRNGSGVAQSESENAAEFNDHFIYKFTKSEHNQVPLLDRSAPLMEDIVVTKIGVTKILKGLNHT